MFAKQRNGNTETMPAEDNSLIENGEAEVNADSDDEQLQSSQGPSTTDEKRKAHREIFKSWVFDKAKEITSEQVKSELDSKNNEELSIRNLLQKQGRPNTIKNPREYQLELYERAKTENTIAVLDTGSGKTLIAVLLLRHIIDEELERRATGQPHRLSFFLVRLLWSMSCDGIDSL
jgi:endoribonuclease Dicer